MKISLLLLLLCCVSIPPLTGQSRMDTEEPSSGELTPGSTADVKAFRGISLGMSLDQVKAILTKDPYFNYTGDADVYILPQKQQHLIDCSGNSFVKHAYFQFHEGRLYIMIIELNENKIDFYSLFTTLYKKYGEYKTFSPQSVIWDKQNTQLSLERPVVVKYVDNNVFGALKEQGKMEKQSASKSLQDFLNEF
jgi:hypothetical protein